MKTQRKKNIDFEAIRCHVEDISQVDSYSQCGERVYATASRKSDTLSVFLSERSPFLVQPLSERLAENLSTLPKGAGVITDASQHTASAFLLEKRTQCGHTP